jgi:predicted DNA-binding protein (MmcQ/YjbR family)
MFAFALLRPLLPGRWLVQGLALGVVRGKNFVFSDPSADHLSFKVTKDEAAAVVATDAAAEPTGYGLGRHGWVSLSVEPDAGEERWTQIAEWVRTSYTLVAAKKLAQLVLIEDGLA